MGLNEQIARAVTLRTTLGGPGNEDGAPAIDIGYGTDAAYVRPMGVSIVSLARHNPGLTLRCHVFASTIHDADVIRLEALAAAYGNLRIFLYDVDAGVFSALPVLNRYPLPIYFRLMMPIVLAGAPRILYLDSDILLERISVGQGAGSTAIRVPSRVRLGSCMTRYTSLAFLAGNTADRTPGPLSY